MTDERTVTVEFTKYEAGLVASALRYDRTISGSTAYGKVRGALNRLNEEPEAPAQEEAPPPEKPKRGRPRKTPATK
jgi:hypothetical protein